MKMYDWNALFPAIAAKADSLELTEEEKKIIDARLEKYHENPELGSPWEDVYKRFSGCSVCNDPMSRRGHSL
jgi:putative addiction module component (TIGR02574 family)